MIGIYKITNLKNNKVYIGQSTNIKKRFNGHIKTANNKNERGYDYPLYRSIRKYGINNFQFEVLEECVKELLDIREIYWIDFYKSSNLEFGYNQDAGGYIRATPKLSEEELFDLIEDLRNTTLDHRQLAEKYGISFYYVSDINIGRQRVVEGLDYPIRKIKKKVSLCEACGEEKPTLDAKLCVKCSKKKQRKVERPEKLILAKEIIETNFSAVGRKYGVSDNAIRRWCVYYDMPKTKKELIEWVGKYG